MSEVRSVGNVTFRVLPGGHAVEVEGGGTFQMPRDDPDNSLEWRLRYALPDQVVKDRYIAAEIVACYRELIFCTEHRRRQVIKSLRAAHKAGAR